MAHVVLKTVTVTIGPKTYSEWSSIDPTYRRCPDEGVVVPMEYYETLPSNDSVVTNDRWTIVCLHGTSTDAKQYDLLMKAIDSNRFRLLVPTLPGWNLEPVAKFRATPREVSKCFSLFLVALDIKKVDTLIVHSGALYLMPYFDHQDISVKSYLFLSPATHEKSHVLHDPAAASMATMHEILKGNRVGRTLIGTVGVPVAKALFGVDIETTRGGSFAYWTSKQVRSSEIRQFLLHLKSSKVPTAMFFAEDDRLFHKQTYYKFIEILGGSTENISTYDTEDDLILGRKVEGFPLVSVVPKGGHRCFMRRTSLIVKIVEEFVSYCENKSRI